MNQLAFALLAVDAGGQTAVVEEYSFAIVDRGAFKLRMDPVPSSSNASDQVFYPLANDGGAEPTPEEALNRTLIAVGERFRFAPPAVNASTTFSVGTRADMQFTFQVIEGRCLPEHIFHGSDLSHPFRSPLKAAAWWNIQYIEVTFSVSHPFRSRL